MKKLLAILLSVLFIAFCFSACGDVNNEGDSVYDTIETENITFQFPKYWNYKQGDVTTISTSEGDRGIQFYSTAYTEEFENTTKESLKAKLEETYSKNNLELSSFQFKKDTSKGFDMFVADFDVENVETPFHETVYMAHVEDKVYMFMVICEHDSNSEFATIFYNSLAKITKIKE